MCRIWWKFKYDTDNNIIIKYTYHVFKHNEMLVAFTFEQNDINTNWNINIEANVQPLQWWCITTKQGRGSNNIWNQQAGVCFYSRRDMSPSNNTYFDVLFASIVQHLINPHVPLSKRPGLKPSWLVRSACSPVDTSSKFQKF